MSDSVSLRTYSRTESVVFRKTKELFGGLSNMASGFPLVINGINIWSSEALYQACRFPNRPDVQKIILGERSPMTAKMRSKPFRDEFTRPDWDQVRVKIMRWCLRVKLAQNWEKFSTLLLSTDQKPIVEDSPKDDFWGAKQIEDGVLVGKNVLGRLLMELRKELTGPSSEKLKMVSAPEVSDFLLLGKPIYPNADTATIPRSGPQNGVVTTSSEESALDSIPTVYSPKPLWPKVTQAELTGNAGVHLAGLTITKELGFIFREKSVSDIGIDAEIEIRKEDKSHGRLIAVQIKAGGSYFKERTQSGFVYRGSVAHLRYWLNYAVPVLVILCDIEQHACWWQLVDLQRIRFHDESTWSIDIPFAQRLDSSAVEELRRIGGRFQKADIVDVLFRNWLVESSYYDLSLANILEQPRDYHWISYLGRKHDQFIMADYVLADLTRFDQAAIEEMVKWAEHNHRLFKYDKLLLALISETSEAFHIKYEPIVGESGLTIELVPLLLTVDGEPRLCEIGASGHLITGYYDHQTWDDWAAEVQPARTLITASEPVDLSSAERSLGHQG